MTLPPGDDDSIEALKDELIAGSTDPHQSWPVTFVEALITYNPGLLAALAKAFQIYTGCVPQRERLRCAEIAAAVSGDELKATEFVRLFDSALLDVEGSAKDSPNVRDTAEMRSWRYEVQGLLNQLGSKKAAPKSEIVKNLIISLEAVPHAYASTVTSIAGFLDDLAVSGSPENSSSRVSGKEVIADQETRRKFAVCIRAADQVAALLKGQASVASMSSGAWLTCLFEMYWRDEANAESGLLFAEADYMTRRIEATDDFLEELVNQGFVARVAIALGAFRTLEVRHREPFIQFLAQVWMKSDGAMQRIKLMMTTRDGLASPSVQAPREKGAFDDAMSELVARFDRRHLHGDSSGQIRGFYTEYDQAYDYRHGRIKQARVTRWLESHPNSHVVSVVGQMCDWVFEYDIRVAVVAFASKYYTLRRRIKRGLANDAEAKVTSGKLMVDGLMRRLVLISGSCVEGFAHTDQDVRRSEIGHMAYSIYHDENGSIRDEFQWNGFGSFGAVSIRDNKPWTWQFGKTFRGVLESKLASQVNVPEQAARVVRCLFLVPMNSKWKPSKADNAIFDVAEEKYLYYTMKAIARTRPLIKRHIEDPIEDCTPVNCPPYFTLVDAKAGDS